MLYICDNLANLDCKLQEEVMTVVGILSGVVGGATGLVMVLESATIDGGDEEELKGRKIAAAEVSSVTFWCWQGLHRGRWP